MRDWHPLVKLFAAIGLTVTAAIAIHDRVAPQPELRASPIVATSAISRMVATPEAARPAAPFPELAALSETPRRPLFAPTRRPWPLLEAIVAERDVANPGSGERPEPLVRYVGSMIDDRHEVAFVSIDGRLYSLSVGDRVEGWETIQIESRRVILERAGERREFSLFSW